MTILQPSLDRHDFVLAVVPEPGLEVLAPRHHLGGIAADLRQQLQDLLLLLDLPGRIHNLLVKTILTKMRLRS